MVVRCPSCGAHNAATAGWCTQCYADLGGSTPPPAVELAVDDGPVEPSPAVRSGPADAVARDVRTVGDEVEWRCARCDDWSPLLAATCVTCGAPRQGFGEPATRPAPDDADRGRAVAASVVLPGLGHLLAGRPGTGAARALLWCSWLLGGLFVVRGADGGAPVLPAVPLLLGAVVLWAGTLRDAVALGSGREWLRPRVLGALTAAVVGTLLLATIAAATAA
jgi:hypothetical protein